MKRILAYSLMVGLSMALAGCSMFQKKEQPQSTEDTSVLSQTTPENTAPEAAPAPEAQPMPAAPAAGQRTHVVQPKETIFSLSRQYYGDEHQWRKIWEANKDQIPDCNKIKIGQQLIIPE